MQKLYPAELKEHFITAMADLAGFKYSEGNPFTISVYTTPYLIYLRNLSPAYFSGSPDITRHQMLAYKAIGA